MPDRGLNAVIAKNGITAFVQECLAVKQRQSILFLFVMTAADECLLWSWIVNIIFNHITIFRTIFL